VTKILKFFFLFQIINDFISITRSMDAKL